MSFIPPIDCDVHLARPSTKVLIPHLDEYWREQVIRRGLDDDDLELSAFPEKAPLNCRPDWQPHEGRPGSRFELLQAHILDRFRPQFVICNVLHGAQILFNVDLSAALCTAINDWIVAEWLEQDPRLRASVVIPVQSPELAALEIEKRATDRRFVQVLMPVMNEVPVGRRLNWPIYAAAERHGLPIGIHAGSSFRHPPSSLGWPSYYIEDYVLNAPAFAGALNSLVAEGVFQKFPRLKVVLMESGVTWLPSHFWRANKSWRAVRSETPWVKKLPSEILRHHVRITLQPFDAPPMLDQAKIILEEIAADEMFLFSTDYPHWHFEGTDAVPDVFTPILSKLLRENALATYERLNWTGK
ncbi:amidohydrolase family protein [Bradyrhizobium cytisi]|uniref:Amidohydrolase n=1 Tax=Bradyrhizobium cytisi TaxID=515489 RepID=A0A5S4VYC2_9BRAD|nr:amidohydrolase family protein [Bradyrhizobium cytisi]TYL71896.1 amidohydrolase [Bradyrhizobium cytisi]